MITVKQEQVKIPTHRKLPVRLGWTQYRVITDVGIHFVYRDLGHALYLAHDSGEKVELQLVL